jgi:hypothetical protein
MNFLKISAFVCFIAAISTSIAQSEQKIFTQTIKGKVTDKASKSGLAGVVVYIPSIGSSASSQTDSSGNFRITDVPVGRYELKANLVGYKSLQLPEIVLNASKVLIVDMEMEEEINTLNEVTVSSGNEAKSNDLLEISSRTFTIEQTQRFAAGFFDPARLVNAFPGVAMASDDGNGVVVRGNSPQGVQWRIEGVDIVNPNHFPNAGTLGDRVSQSGGGVNILSGQVLGNSKFLTGAFASEYGNAIAGVFDLRLRKGNNEKREYTIQAGFTGIDLAAEGPFAKGKKSSYLINARYSTTGLLGLMGVKFGGQLFDYYDVSSNFIFPTKKLGTFTIFAFGGSSINTFEPETDSTKWKTTGDRTPFNFTTRTGAVGATHSVSLSKNISWHTSMALSGIQSLIQFDYLAGVYNRIGQSMDKTIYGRYSIHSYLQAKVNNRLSLRVGMKYNYLFFDLESKQRLRLIILNDFWVASYNQDFDRNVLEKSGNSSLLMPYIELTFKLSDKWKTIAGLHYTYFALNNQHSVDPRAQIQGKISPKYTIEFAYGLHSQIQPLGTYFITDPMDGSYINRQLGLSKSHHFGFSNSFAFSSNTKIKAELFYQHLFNIPIGIERPTKTLSILNSTDGLIFYKLANNGTGRNYGLELGIERNIDKGFYYLANVTLYESKYTALDGIERNTRFNGNHIVNLTIGKEFPWNRNGKNRTFGINLRTTWLGGWRATPIDTAQSNAIQTTVYENSKAFTTRQPNYFKTDLRFYIKKQKKNYTRILSLDIQNLTDHQNVNFYYYDTQANKVLAKYQLPFLPVLNYRVEF